mmetsp:Transcript_1475/g.3264  ORF Transcript_1475/g.3264 Transcript_1475/m.3264 type:complete len:82 (+) Transcript_1475:33-278(+)
MENEISKRKTMGKSKCKTSRESEKDCLTPIDHRLLVSTSNDNNSLFVPCDKVEVAPMPIGRTKKNSVACTVIYYSIVFYFW